MKDLTEIRTEIDSIDNELLELFKRRMDCSKAVAEYKEANNIPIFNAQREEEILNSVEQKGGEYGEYARELFKKIMELSRDLQRDRCDGTQFENINRLN